MGYHPRMDALRKAYILVLALALLVLLLLRPPMTFAGWAGVGITLVSLVGMGAWTTGVTALGGRFWLIWLAVQVVGDAVAVRLETDTLGFATGGGRGALAIAVSGIVLLPLYLALYGLGRRRFPRAPAATEVDRVGG